MYTSGLRVTFIHYVTARCYIVSILTASLNNKLKEKTTRTSLPYFCYQQLCHQWLRFVLRGWIQYGEKYYRRRRNIRLMVKDRKRTINYIIHEKG
jgi:hypothetical protein